VKQNATLMIMRHRQINIKMFSGMVVPTGDPTTLKKEERAMRPTPEVVRKWSSGETANAPSLESHSIDIRFRAILPMVINYNKRHCTVECTLHYTAHHSLYQVISDP